MQLEVSLQGEKNTITETVIAVGNQDIAKTCAGNFMVIQYVVEVKIGGPQPQAHI